MGKLLLQCRTSIQSFLRSGAVFPINGRMRDELLNETMFRNLAHTRAVRGIAFEGAALNGMACG